MVNISGSGDSQKISYNQVWRKQEPTGNVHFMFSLH
jgi:hypothetical protein